MVRKKEFDNMLSEAKIQEYMKEAIELFGQVMPLPVPDISYTVAPKSKLNKVVEEQTKLVEAIYSEDCCERNWAGITFPGHNGIAIVLRKSFITGSKIKFRYILWHEMGHAYAFAYESTEKYWHMNLSQEDAYAYRFWQEVVANYIALRVAMITGTQIGFPTGISLKQALAGSTRELAYYCSEAYFTGTIAYAPKGINDLAIMMIEKLHQERFWEIDESWINRVKLQLDILGKMKL